MVDDTEASEEDAMSRRRVLRATLGTGAAVAAWSAPHVKSLVITPNYAAAATIPTGTVEAVQVIFARDCNNANEEVNPIPGLPGATFTIIDKLCQSGKTFDWSIAPAGCTVTGMYCTQADADLGTPFVTGFVAGTGQTGVNTCFPEVGGGLWIDVECV